MSITSLQFVLSQFETEKYRYFIISDEDGDPVYMQNDLIDQESALAKIRSFLKDNNGYFTIKVFGKKLTNPKNRAEQDKNLVTKFNVELTHKLNQQAAPLMGAVGGFGGFGGYGGYSGLPSDDPRSNAPNIYDLQRDNAATLTQLKLMEKDHQHYREMKELQDRIERMEKDSEKATGMNGVLSTLGDNFKDPAVLMGLLSTVGGLFKKPDVMPMNGINEDVETNISLRKKAMLDSVNTLMKLDANFPENITALAALAQNKPDTYKMAVNYLKSM
jgi:hypothetical protein